MTVGTMFVLKKNAKCAPSAIHWILPLGFVKKGTRARLSNYHVMYDCEIYVTTTIRDAFLFCEFCEDMLLVDAGHRHHRVGVGVG